MVMVVVVGIVCGLYVVMVGIVVIAVYLLADVGGGGGFCVCDGVAVEFPVFPSILPVVEELLTER